MNSFFEQLFAYAWNRAVAKPAHPTNPNSLSLGFQVIDGRPTTSHTVIPQIKRAEHMAILGRTGTGKSSLLRYMASQDIAAGRGFLFFDLARRRESRSAPPSGPAGTNHQTGLEYKADCH